MRTIRYSTAVSLALITFTTALAQTSQPTFDLTPTLRALQNDSPEQAASRMAGLPPEALLPAYLSLERSDLPDNARRSIEEGLPALAQRAAAARMKRDGAVDIAWAKKTGIEAFTRIGVHHPASDPLAIDALTHIEPNSAAATFARFKKAIDAGCTDPLVRYYYATRGLTSGDLSQQAAIDSLTTAVDDLGKSRYATGRKYFATVRLVEMLAVQPDALGSGLPNLRHRLDVALALFTNIGPEHMGPASINESIFSLYRNLVFAGKNRKDAFDTIDPVLRANYANTFLPYAFEATFYVEWAWDARGTGYADTVTEEGWKLMRERIDLAEKAARQGFAIDPSDTLCPNAMVGICMAQSYDRPEMEKWFFRAMTNYPHDKTACLAKLQYLLPRWHGTAEETLAFGRECVARGNGADGIPLVLVEAHAFLAQTASDPDAYYENPKVWSDLQSAYEKVLADEKAVPPLNPVFFSIQRAHYLSCAIKCKQWTAFLDLSKRFGNDFDMKELGGQAKYEFYKKQAATELRKSPL